MLAFICGVFIGIIVTVIVTSASDANKLPEECIQCKIYETILLSEQDGGENN